MTAPARVLLAEDEVHLGSLLETFLVGRGHSVTRVCDGRAALDAARACTYDVALLDVVMPEMDGLEVLDLLVRLPLGPEAIVMTGNGTVETALRALKLGAYDYLTKPYRMAEVDELVRRAAEKRCLRVEREARRWSGRIAAPAEPFTAHPPLAAALDAAAGRARAGTPPRVVAGPRGSGRATVARWLAGLAIPGHPAVEVRCTGDDDVDLASLFGAGDTSAHPADRAGALGLAGRGAVVVRRAHRLSPSVADVLAGALESGTYDRRDGSGRARVPVLLLATADAGWIEEGGALARALCTDGSVSLPALAERVVDIGRLAERVLAAAGARPLAPAALRDLEGRAWPGDVTELLHVLSAAAARATGHEVSSADLGVVPSLDGASRTEEEGAGTLASIERDRIAAVLAEEGWHRARAARRLGISQRTLYRRIREYGFDRPSA